MTSKLIVNKMLLSVPMPKYTKDFLAINSFVLLGLAVPMKARMVVTPPALIVNRLFRERSKYSTNLFLADVMFSLASDLMAF